MTDEEVKAELARRKRDDLRVIAKRLKVKNYSRVSREELIILLSQEGTLKQVSKVLSVSRWDRYRHHLFDWSKSELLTIVFGVGGIALTIVVYRLSVPVTNSNKDKNELATSRTDQNVNGQPSSSPITQKTPEVPSPTPTPNTTPVPAATPRVSPLKEAGKQASLYLARAHELYEQGQYQAALSQCNKILSLEPSNKEAKKLKSKIERTIAILNNN